MRLEELLAVPMQPCIRVRYGPKIDDVVEIDEVQFERRKDEFIEHCFTIPNLDGANWRILKPYAGDNGLMAKVLIALGQMIGIWKMWPDPNALEFTAWGDFHPSIQMGTVVKPPPSVLKKERVPKPSRGDLELDVSTCSCCDRPMGPMDSTIHDLRVEEDDRCFQCVEECGEDGPCRLFAAKLPIRKIIENQSIEEARSPAVEAEIKAFFDTMKKLESE